jgi:hypothetical protein
MTRILTNRFIIFSFLVAASTASIAEQLQAVWDDPEYQAFVQDLKPSVPPLTAEEQKIPTKELMALTWNQFEKIIRSILPLLLQAGGDLSALDWKAVYTEKRISQVEELIRLNGNLFINEKRLKELSIAEFSDGLVYLGFAGFLKYLAKQSDMEISAKKVLYDWAYAAFDLPEIYFPNHPTVQKNEMFLSLVKPLFRSIAVRGEPLPEQYAPITNKDVAGLRSKLESWMKKIPVNEASFSMLKGGLPGYYSEEIADELFSAVGDDFTYLILFYQPDDYRQAAFNCTRLERMFIGSEKMRKKGFSCHPRMMEFMLFSSLLTPATKTGEKMSNEKTYEHWYVGLFLAKHYGDLLDKMHTGISSTLRQWASEFANTVEQFDRPDEELNLFEKLMKPFRFRNHNMERTRELAQECRAFLKE